MPSCTYVLLANGSWEELTNTCGPGKCGTPPNAAGYQPGAVVSVPCNTDPNG